MENEETNEHEGLGGFGPLEWLAIVTAINVGMLGANLIGHYSEKRSSEPIRADISYINKDPYLDLRIKTNGGREFILYGTPKGQFYLSDSTTRK
ncbi:hypothetical protein J4422_01400 [Candidatus Pacearchaeota archaeon]|nr:hypothetical protein [Candidatus Pacearchaeota archaeon]